MTRREFIFGSAVCTLMPCIGNDNQLDAFSCFDECIKCKNDIVYFAEKHITLQNKNKLTLKNWQKHYLRHLASGKNAVLAAHRQSGKTLMNIIYAVWKVNFDPNQKITFIFSCKRTSEWNFRRCAAIFDNLPSWMSSRDRSHEHYMRDKKHIMIANGSELVMTHANADFCGYQPGNILVSDEVASFTLNQCLKIAEQVVPCVGLCKNSQLIVASTPLASEDTFSQYVKHLMKANSDRLFVIPAQ